MNNIEENKDITHLSNFKTPAKVRYYFEVNKESDLKDLIEVVDFWKKNKLSILFVASGTNMFFAFDVYQWIVIKNNLIWWNYNSKKKTLEAYSSSTISDIAESIEKDYSQDIWHRFIGLPWTVWWAVFWNAGCFGLEIENNFLEWKILDLNSGQVSIISKKEMNFSYRSSILKEKNGKYFLISAIFDLSKVVEKYPSDTDNIYFREYKQPKGNTCWSFFKNPSREQTAWYLIEQVWLKWYKNGGAFFSSIHANFLMNDWGTYKEVLGLIELAQEKVKQKFGINLINEVRIITN